MMKMSRFFEVTLVTGFYNETNSNETKLREFVSLDVTDLRRNPDFIRSKKWNMYLFMIVTTQVFNAPLILLIGGSFILRGPVRPGPSETTYCRNFLLFHLIHHQLRGNFILRGRFGPVCQRLPIVETSSTLTKFNSTAPPFSHSSSTGT